MEGANVVCKHCGATFDTKGRYQTDYRREHQSNVKTTERAENDRFNCICSKQYDVYQSLVRHQKICKPWQDNQAAVIPLETMESEEESDLEGTVT